MHKEIPGVYKDDMKIWDGITIPSRREHDRMQRNAKGVWRNTKGREGKSDRKPNIVWIWPVPKTRQDSGQLLNLSLHVLALDPMIHVWLLEQLNRGVNINTILTTLKGRIPINNQKEDLGNILTKRSWWMTSSVNSPIFWKHSPTIADVKPIGTLAHPGIWSSVLWNSWRPHCNMDS